jgi:ubiquinone/menaquinone biosynthesis C-methylase UbiE
MTDGPAAAQRFYGRWARVYDAVARHTPGIGDVRGEFVDALDLQPGDTVVEMGCGTGANVPYLRDRVGPEGRVVGVDFTRPALGRARAAAPWDNVSFVRGDAAAPPVDGPVDAVVATFVVGMLPNPARAVGDWIDLLGPGGRVGLLDAASSRRWYAGPANVAFRAFVRASAPAPTRWRRGESPASVLDRRVADARQALKRRSRTVHDGERALGYLHLAVGHR